LEIIKVIDCFSLFIFLDCFFSSHREEITAERLTPFRVFMIANPRDKFTAGEVKEIDFIY
jgi:hypothetical protein